MGTLTLRLPENLDARLSELARLEDTSRSELARTALEKFLREVERDQLLSGMVEAARFLAANPEARAESTSIAEEFLPLDNEALDIAEGRKTRTSKREKWWK